MENYALWIELPFPGANPETKRDTAHVMINVKDRMEAIQRVAAEIHPQATITRIDGPYPFNRES